MKKLKQIFAATVLAVASLFTLASPQIAHALAPYTCTWTGSGGNANFSTAGNWSGCNSAAPQAGDGDTLVFDVTSLGANATLNNNITSLTLGGITFQGTSSNHYTFTIGGNATTIGGTISATSTSGFNTLDIPLTLSANLTLSGTFGLGDSNAAAAFNLNGHNVTTDANATNSLSVYDNVSGAGNILTPGTTFVNFYGDNSAWTGALNVSAAGLVSSGQLKGLGANSNTITIASGGELILCGFNNAAVPQNITVGGAANNGAIEAYSICGGPSGTDTSAAKVTLSGSITLTANTQFYAQNTMTITGPLSGQFTLTPVSGMAGTLVINSSNNTSLTPNGSAETPVQTVNYPDNSPTTPIEVNKNVTAIVDGSYGSVSVDSGGILKGTGSMTDLEVNGGGVVAPGHSPGCLTVSGSLSLGGTYQAEIGGTTACTQYDQMIVSGTVGLDDSRTPATQGSLQLSLVNNFKPSTGQTFEIINNKGTDPVRNTFANLPEGSTITVSKYVFKISYKGGDGNDVVLSVIGVPNTGFALVKSNPLVSAGVTLGAAAGLLVIAQRKKFAFGYKRK